VEEAAAVAAAVVGSDRNTIFDFDIHKGVSMVGAGRIVGIVLMAISAIFLIGVAIWAISESSDPESLMTTGGLALALFLALVVLAPIFGVGVYVFRKGSVEQSQFAVVKQEKKLLNMVLTQGQVTIPELAVELNEPRDTVEDMIRDLVGKQLFSGAVNWEKGVLYSVESQQLTAGRKCPNCGGELQFAGKGLIVCPFCGSEVFLTKRAAAETAPA
jgi:hypothetical protein